MNYHDHIGQMLKHLIDNNTKANVDACVNAPCNALVGVLAESISDHDQMHHTLAALHEQMQSKACDLHSEIFGSKEDHEEEPLQVDAETFLRDHFNPERFHG